MSSVMYLTAITVNDIQSIIFAVYNVNMYWSKLRKTKYFTCIMVEIQNVISKYTRCLPKDHNEVYPNTNAPTNNVTTL